MPSPPGNLYRCEACGLRHGPTPDLHPPCPRCGARLIWLGWRDSRGHLTGPDGLTVMGVEGG